MTATPEQKSKLVRLIPLLTLILLILLFFNKLAFTNLILARGDTFLYFYPYWRVAADALRSWSLPLWNPAIFMGAPLLANSQMGFFYPLNWPVWLFFDTPYAATASILLHILIAGAGTYAAARRVLLLDRTAALVSAVTFALGGYLTAQVEHINQLQGLSWLPWLLLAVAREPKKGARHNLLLVIAVGILFSLQLLAGHTQTAFISVVALTIWTITQRFVEPFARKGRSPGQRPSVRPLLLALALLLAGGIVALLLSAVQLVPTLELAALSSREGGLALNEGLSFSLNPLLLTRSLFPTVGQSLFTEYVAYLPLAVLALAFIGAWQWRRWPGVLPAIVWLAVALLLGLGVFNPINWLLVQLPGFNLFRVPARWLVLYALGIALLAGVGWQVLSANIRSHLNGAAYAAGDKRSRHDIIQPLLWFLILFAFLVIWGFAAGLLVGILPTGDEAPFAAPTWFTVAAWAVEILLLALIGILLVRKRPRRIQALLMPALFGLIVLVLFISSRTLPYNNPTTPDAFFDLRSSTTRLIVESAGYPSRLLSLSDIFFDPGDQAEIDAIYADQLSESAQYDYTIAVKQKEIMSPNLPMLVGLTSVDGFDGGVLPLQTYTELMKLILPEGTTTTDGRLREHLHAVPEARWLDLFNARFLITDKVGDVWRDGVFFDRQHPLELRQGDSASVGYLPDFEATELRLLASNEPGTIQITNAAKEVWTINPSYLGQDLYQALFPAPTVPQHITIGACPDIQSCELRAVSLFDQRDSSFQSLVLGDYRLIHSGDVKIYENLNALPRAFLVTEWDREPDNNAALARMQSPEFDPHTMAILSSDADDLPSSAHAAADGPPEAVEIKEYTPVSVDLASNGSQDAMLILSDAHYPGWRATVDGQPSPIYRANVLFRAIFVPAGSHEIRLTFEPTSVKIGLVLTLASLAIVSIILGGLYYFRNSHQG